MIGIALGALGRISSNHLVVKVMKWVIYLGGALLLLSACSSKPSTPPVFSEMLITSINDYGMKQFTYDVVLAAPEMGRARPPGGARRGGPPGGGPQGGSGDGPGRGGMGGPGGTPAMEHAQSMRRKMNKDPETAIAERLEQILSETKFCKNGYFVMQKDIDGSAAHVVGECKSVIGE